MLASMTGFGRTVLEYKSKKITIDIKSLNSKSLDLNIRIPSFYREKELEIRHLILENLQRGKVELIINIELDSLKVCDQINSDAIVAYYNMIKEISIKENIPIGNETILGILRMPEVMKNSQEDLENEEWQSVLIAIKKTIDNCIEFRIKEGRSIEIDIKQKINSILNLLLQVTGYELERINSMREKIRQAIAEIGNTSYDTNRYEQEIIYYLEKLDINEEKVRLKKHCDYFIETINTENFAGKKLGFISQEMGREINTLGSKAHHAEIQKIVVMMKDELEKIKEQLLNVL
jgi:uncharacterized protein (TIGR00255 family)